MTRLTALLIAIVAALGVVACGEERAPETDTALVSGPSDSLIVYERAGGEEGARERLEVRADGAARVNDGDRSGRAKLTGQELNDLREARGNVDFAKLKPFYGTGKQVLDAYETRFTADGRLVVIVNDAEVPAELQKLRDVCAALFERYRPR